MSEIKDIIGMTFTSVRNNEDEEIIFTGPRSFKLYHEQDCCEGVSVVDLCGDLNDLCNTPILDAIESVSDGIEDDYGSQTWTFYRVSTIKGTVVMWWQGSPNGYYSETVDFKEIGKDE